MNNQNPIQINKITLASTDIESMVLFYSQVFSCKFVPKQAYGTTLYAGKILGLNLLLCPNEIAGVKAEQSRHQFEFKVPDLEETIELCISNCGRLLGEVFVKEQQKTATITDPDGNTLVFIQNLQN
ncbi:MAG: hypothetical protein IPM47_09375 [Sphingobacteriales bacterium]|nr:MAG: hypothetical protein IPM47_09375 [Sphingobacteriales bacterium]